MTRLRFDKTFFRDLWELLKPYWTSEEKWSAFGLLFLCLLCLFGEVWATVGFNNFHKIFFNALQNLDKNAILHSLYYLFFVASFLAIATSAGIYFLGVLSARWRRWLTHYFLQKWLSNHNHYRIQLNSDKIDNPDQRISEDLAQFPSITLSLFLEPYKFLHSILMIFSFGYILFGLSHYFIFHYGNHTFTIPGYLCWIALIYAICGTWMISWLGKKLPFLRYEQQHFNADFRFSLVRLREASEQVSLYRGESQESNHFQYLFNRIFKNIIRNISLSTRLAFFNKFYGFISYVLGFAVSIPFYLAKVFQLGTVMQISSAYNSVVGAFSTFLESYSELADWRSVVHRLAEFNRSIENTNTSQINIHSHEGNELLVKNLQVGLPNGKILLKNINFSFIPGESILINAPSGTGKTTLLRALAGIWPFGEGNIVLPHASKILFLPQKPYLPLGSLKNILSYPQNEIEHSKLLEIMKQCHLDKFTNELDHDQNWVQKLSLGEQQLISFARIFLSAPDLIFLDEATSAMDEETELDLYQKIKNYLPHSIIVSVGHRRSLHKFHEKIIDLENSLDINELEQCLSVN